VTETRVTKDATTLPVDYRDHLSRKTARIAALLKNRALDVPFEGIEPCPLDSGFRLHAKFGVEWSGAGATSRPIVTGHDPRRGRVPYRESVWILPEPGPGIVEGVVSTIEARHATHVTGFELRLEQGGEGAHLELAVPRSSRDFDTSLPEDFLAACPPLRGVSVPARKIDCGDTSLRHRIRNRTIEADYRAFFQSNTGGLAALVDGVMAEVSAREDLVDLYCGVGLFSLVAAGPGSRVLGVDWNRWAIASAERNAAAAGVRPARFLRDDVEHAARNLEARRPSHVFLNPSRLGSAAALPAHVVAWEPRTVTLISCSIDAHVADLCAFRDLGYRAESIQSFDMFPFTHFVESVSVMRPSEGGS
jgi:tRNA/tmRNA/rRNA uracil-C5-methylase (TrmA/RlmC/RlmD family)